MPSTFNGVGTRYCGRRDEAADGSYVTTVFIVVGHIPLVPLSSWRVRPSGPPERHHVRWGWGSSDDYEHQNFQVQPVPIHWRQVGEVYVDGVIFIGVIALALLWVGLLLGLTAAAMSAPDNRRALWVFLIIAVAGSGAIVGKRLVRRARRVTGRAPRGES